MNNKITVAAVFDRRKEIAKGRKDAKVEIRITVNRESKYWPCTFRLEKRDWDARNYRVRYTDHAEVYNEEIRVKVDKVYEYYNKIMKAGIKWNFNEFFRYAVGKDSELFIPWVRKRIAERTDITESTRKQHTVQINLLEEFGGIVFMGDVTYENVVRYQEWLQRHYDKQSTVWTKIKTFKHYVNEAVMFGLVAQNPFARLKISRGTHVGAKVLEYEDFKKIMSLELSDSLKKARDIMEVQFYTGLSYTDLMEADFKHLDETGGGMLIGKRQKTHQSYYIPITPELRSTLERLDYAVPKMCMQPLNVRYRLLAEMAGIKYAISTHSVRKGCATHLINKGVSLEIIARIMGHATTIETERIYARLSKERISESVLKALAC